MNVIHSRVNIVPFFVYMFFSGFIWFPLYFVKKI